MFGRRVFGRRVVGGTVRGWAGAFAAAGLLASALVTAAPAAAAQGAPPQRYVVTTQTPDGPVFRSVLAPTPRAAMLRVAGSSSAERDLRVAALPVDPLRSRQWALNRVSFERAWTVSRGAGVVVGVVDSGVDARHPDLQGRVLPGWTFTGAGFTSRAGQSDDVGHGTHVAGIIAARVRNGIGVSGAAPDARILPVRVFDEDGIGWASDVASGIVWVANRGARVINLSLGAVSPSPALSAAVRHAQSRGALVVAAAGNSGDGGFLEHPAALPGVLGVGAVDPGGVAAAFSTTGAVVDVAAPGLGVLSTVPVGVDDKRYVPQSGTSMAVPYAAAAAALVRAARPALSAAQVAQRLEQTAEDIAPAGRDQATGAGLVDPAAALGLARQRTPAALAAPTGLRVREVADGSVHVSWQPVAGARGYEVLVDRLPLNLITAESGEPPAYVLRGTTAVFSSFPRSLPLPLQVVAVDRAGLWGAASSVLKGLVPARPVPSPKLRITSTGSRRVALAWSAVRAPNLFGYGIIRNGKPYMFVEGEEFSFVDAPKETGPDAPRDGERYAYRVVALTEEGESDPSNTVVARPFRPYRTSAPKVTARAAAGGVTVSWSAPVPGQLGWRVYVDGGLTAQLRTSVRSTVVTSPGRHRVTVARYSHPTDQGPGSTVTVAVPAARRLSGG